MTRPSLAVLMDVIQADELQGFCLNCGEVVDNVEPDARKYECDVCGDTAVYGAEEILLCGWYQE